MFTAVCILFSVTDLSTGRVGAPLQCCELMLRDWAEGTFSSHLINTQTK